MYFSGIYDIYICAVSVEVAQYNMCKYNKINIMMPVRGRAPAVSP